MLRGVILKSSKIILICFWARHWNLIVPVSEWGYKWLAKNCNWGKPGKMQVGCYCNLQTNKQISNQARMIILLVPSCYKDQDKLWPDGRPGLIVEVTFTFYLHCSNLTFLDSCESEVSSPKAKHNDHGTISQRTQLNRPVKVFCFHSRWEFQIFQNYSINPQLKKQKGAVRVPELAFSFLY